MFEQLLLYWNRTVIEFPGKSAQKIYQLIKSHQFDWKFFHTPSFSLTHFDLYYHVDKVLTTDYI